MNQRLLTIDEYKNIELDILSFIDEVCRKNNINYSIAYGTLLGAIRHKGFIPWDDDIDIFLLRDDYDKLIELLKKENKPEWLSVMDDTTMGYYYLFAKAVDNRTIAKMENNTTSHGVWVDIFPLDSIPDDSKKQIKYLKKCKFYRAVVIAMTTDFTGHKKNVKYYIKRLLAIYSRMIGKDKLMEKYKKHIRDNYAPHSNNVGNASSPYTMKECLPREWFEKYEDVMFEGFLFRMISSYSIFLETIYGDYMKLPPENKRVQHGLSVKMVSENR